MRRSVARNGVPPYDSRCVEQRDCSSAPGSYTAAMADAGNGADGAEDGKGNSKPRRAGSTYLKFIERFASFCQRSDAMSSSDDSDSAAPLDGGFGRTGGRSWMHGRLGRSKKGPDQVRGKLFRCGVVCCGRVLQKFKNAA